MEIKTREARGTETESRLRRQGGRSRSTGLVSGRLCSCPVGQPFDQLRWTMLSCCPLTDQMTRATERDSCIIKTQLKTRQTKREGKRERQRERETERERQKKTERNRNRQIN